MIIVIVYITLRRRVSEVARNGFEKSTIDIRLQVWVRSAAIMSISLKIIFMTVSLMNREDQTVNLESLFENLWDKNWDNGHPAPGLRQVGTNHVNLLEFLLDENRGLNCEFYNCEWILKSHLSLHHPNESSPVTRFLLHPILGIIAQHNWEVKTLGSIKVDNYLTSISICTWLSAMWLRRSHMNPW